MTTPCPPQAQGNPTPNPLGAPATGALEFQNAALIDRDVEHLRILSICWYVASGLAALAGCFPVIYVILGLMVILSPGSFGPAKAPPPPPMMGWFFFLMGSAFMLIGWTAAILGLLTGLSLPKRRRLWVCYAAAAIACLQIPIGTTLGVFTFIVLARPSVRASFG